ncbi:hypothetical protein GE061_003975 [Apolygus lucorum]|uniref:Uncharacterized protein n=1 Tax=Apolygus lucorum TaxID=248454 RepID=A0A8S9WY29_APOLU|nr:hypothetical protein GE061_003975 [Apolygus lucorum]
MLGEQGKAGGLPGAVLDGPQLGQDGRSMRGEALPRPTYAGGGGSKKPVAPGGGDPEAADASRGYLPAVLGKAQQMTFSSPRQPTNRLPHSWL